MKKNHCMLIYYQRVVKEVSGEILKKYYTPKNILRRGGASIDFHFYP